MGFQEADVQLGGKGSITENPSGDQSMARCPSRSKEFVEGEFGAGNPHRETPRMGKYHV